MRTSDPDWWSSEIIPGSIPDFYRRPLYLDQEIWTLQGRHRDMVGLADYLHTQPGETWDGLPEYMPGIRDGEWDYVETSGRHFNRDRFEDFKTRFYRFQGWNPDTGWPTRPTLESMGLKMAADELEMRGKLGASHSS